MPTIFKGAPVFISSMKDARWFYEKVLGQIPEIDAGEYVAYVGGVSLWEKNAASGMIYGQPFEGALGADNFELYFEADDIDAVWERAVELGAKTQNPLAEAPWGQRSFRLRDPDEYLVEVAEPMTLVIRRCLANGMSEADVVAKTHMPVEAVRHVAAG
jgi:catechol 2,3-dioxygenase-like lactoylglutathione lyase family enzyme